MFVRYAPECVYFGKFTSKSDVWSFGVTLWEIWSFGDLPYEELTGREVLEMIDQEKRLLCPVGCSQLVFEVRGDGDNKSTFKRRRKLLQKFIVCIFLLRLLVCCFFLFREN